MSQVSDRRSTLSNAEGEQILHSRHLPMLPLFPLQVFVVSLLRSALHGTVLVSAHALFGLRAISARLGLLPYISICILNSYVETKSPAMISNARAPIVTRICQAGMSDTPSRSMTCTGW